MAPTPQQQEDAQRTFWGFSAEARDDLEARGLDCTSMDGRKTKKKAMQQLQDANSAISDHPVSIPNPDGDQSGPTSPPGPASPAASAQASPQMGIIGSRLYRQWGTVVLSPEDVARRQRWDEQLERYVREGKKISLPESKPISSPPTSPRPVTPASNPGTTARTGSKSWLSASKLQRQIGAPPQLEQALGTSDDPIEIPDSPRNDETSAAGAGVEFGGDKRTLGETKTVGSEKRLKSKANEESDSGPAEQPARTEDHSSPYHTVHTRDSLPKALIVDALATNDEEGAPREKGKGKASESQILAQMTSAQIQTRLEEEQAKMQSAKTLIDQLKGRLRGLQNETSEQRNENELGVETGQEDYDGQRTEHKAFQEAINALPANQEFAEELRAPQSRMTGMRLPDDVRVSLKEIADPVVDGLGLLDIDMLTSDNCATLEYAAKTMRRRAPRYWNKSVMPAKCYALAARLDEISKELGGGAGSS